MTDLKTTLSGLATALGLAVLDLYTKHTLTLQTALIGLGVILIAFFAKDKSKVGGIVSASLPIAKEVADAAAKVTSNAVVNDVAQIIDGAAAQVQAAQPAQPPVAKVVTADATATGETTTPPTV
jgi:hypothetical protein